MTNIDHVARSDRGAGLALLLVSGLAWVAVLFAPDDAGLGIALYVAAWTVMMAAMMLPSMGPLVLLHRRSASATATAALIAGYLTVWAAAGIPAFLAHHRAMAMMSLAPFVLATAGIYQLTPFRESCLARCRSPADFLVQRWGRGPFRLGLEHGAWCLGCCWALMAVLVMVGMMGIAWVAGLAALVAVEKLNRRGVLVSRLAGIVMIGAAITMGIT